MAVPIVCMQVERNHHWDILFRCHPRQVSVTYKVSQVAPDGSSLQWWKYKLHLREVRRGAGIYAGIFDAKMGMGYTYHHRYMAWLPILTVVLWGSMFVGPCMVSIVLFPSNLLKFIRRERNCKESLSKLIDAPGCRSNYMPLFKIFLENIACIFTGIGLYQSFLRVFVNCTESDLHLGEAVMTPYEFWRDKQCLRGIELLSQTTFALWGRLSWHALATAMLLLRLLEISFIFPETSFVMITILFAFFPVLHFFAVFGIVVLGFSVIIFGLYGAMFPLFSTIPRTAYYLVLHSFSLTSDPVEIHRENEVAAFGLQRLLLVFQVLAVVLMLNMFTTIFIDAYNVAVNNSSPEQIEKLKAAAWYRMKIALGYGHDVDEELGILGGVPGRIFLRATVTHNADPLSIETKIPTAEEMYQKMDEAIDVILRMKSQLNVLARSEHLREEGGPKSKVCQHQLVPRSNQRSSTVTSPPIETDPDEDTIGLVITN
eukprot:GHVO01016907.1.p1 GENE.GHVO01016907.1~~GHVO01016907.1.p1  ORF type:complete len:485 (+),score=80.65 GHVO01016907.1:354-1808(+)